MTLKFDWLDALLISLSFVGGLYLFADSIWLLDYLPTFCLVIYSARRIIFKPAPLPEPKTGLIWSLCSIFGLLLMFSSIAFLLLSWSTIRESKAPVPNFRPEVEKLHQEIQSSTRSISAILNAVKVPANATEAEIKQLRDEKNKALEKQKEQWILERVHKRKQKFIKRKSKRYDDGIKILTLGIFVGFCASLLLRIRYPFTNESTLSKNQF